MEFGIKTKDVFLSVFFFFSFIRGTLAPCEILVSRNTLVCDIDGI